MISAVEQEFFLHDTTVDALLSLFNHLPMVQLYIKDYRGDAGGVFLFVNDRSLQEKGLRDRRRVLGKTDYDFHPRALARQYRAEDEAVLSSGRPVLEQPWLVVESDRTARIWKSSKFPLYLPDGSPKGIVGAMYVAVDDAHASGHERGITRSLVYVQQHLGEKLTLQRLAKVAGYSPSRFGVLFREMMSESPGDYIKRMRVRAAARELQEKKTSVGEIAVKFGFYDHSHFSRQFKEVLGVSPSEYRG